jgi:hypothetical protein
MIKPSPYRCATPSTIPLGTVDLFSVEPWR